VPDFSPAYNEFLNTVKSDILSELSNQGRRATGSLANSLRVVANADLEAELRGNFYIEFLQTGIGSKPKGVSKSFVNAIESWMSAKNITGDANAIAESIRKRGTAIRRGQRGIDIDQIIRDNTTTLLSDMGKVYEAQFIDGFKVN